jgi:hypothetical protein
MFETFLQFFPACLLFCTLAFIVIDEWRKADRFERRTLMSRCIRVGDRFRLVQEDGNPLCDIDIRTYFDDLPNHRRF